MIDWTLFGTIVFVPVVRAFFGWGENALEDGVIDWPEWRELLKTVLRLGVPSTALFFGLDMPLEVAVGIPVIADYIMGEIKKAIDRSKQ